jgi:rhodanese-related sulfurtransferase/rubrerythrin
MSWFPRDSGTEEEGWWKAEEPMRQPKSMTTGQAKQYLDTHRVSDYNLVDVRQDWEYEEFHLPGAKLIPLPELADRLSEVPSERPTLVYCAAGARSASAASIMSGQGIEEVYNIVGGARAWEDEYAIGPVELGMMYFSGHEPPLEIVAVAYAMEGNLGTFFTQMASSAETPEIGDTFKELARFEQDHKATLFRIARDLDPSVKDVEALEQMAAVTALEGGITVEDFLEKNRDYLRTRRGIVEAAMMIEAQALDLYMRYADKAGREEAVRLLHQLAEEEKSHLKILARLMDRKIVGDAGK